MPIQRRWTDLTEENVNRVSRVWGTYELGNRLRNIIYIGRSDNLRRRLMEHLNSSDECIQKAFYFRFDDGCSGERQCCYAERRELITYRDEHGRLPECNDNIPTCAGM
jgi:GIY-YIG catalytic domain-containing protein